MLNEKISVLKGIGPKKSELLASVGITTLGELLRFFPVKYNYYEFYDSLADINCDTKALFRVKYDGNGTRIYSPKTGNFISWIFTENNTKIRFYWFNQPYILATLKKGQTYCVKCEVKKNGKLLSAANPHFYAENEYGQSTLEPVYKQIRGISQKEISGYIGQAIDLCREDEDFFPHEITDKFNLPDKFEALKSVHFPKNEEDGINGMRRFIFEEFFMFAMRQRILKAQLPKEGSEMRFKTSDIAEFGKNLPYELTEDQRKALNSIVFDMRSQIPMNRIIQGDVGSGKTIVAFAACYMAKLSGKQSIIMAPTEVLARQHKEAFNEIFHDYMINCELLVGSITKKDKICIKNKFEHNEIDVLIGTHALLEDDVFSDNVGLAIIDEQHRFGVRQRFEIKEKGKPINLLSLTATPIPRTLAMTAYGGLDVSIIGTMPSGRIPIKTYAVNSTMHERIYKFIVKEVKNGRQAYVICPLVDDDEKASVKSYYEQLRKNELSSVRVGMMYGKMKPEEKEEVMRLFASREMDVLISTTVIEVGVNVPNASVIIIENAENFGLAQLHQLRGRVGRGQYKSYCILVSDSKTETAIKRLDALVKNTSGFDIAEMDLEMRGAGEFFGLRQHGEQQFTIGVLPRDAGILLQALEASDFIEKNKQCFIDFYNYIFQSAQSATDGVVMN